MLDEFHIREKLQRLQEIWANSFWPVLALLCGLLVGLLVGRAAIVDDCRFAGAFRVDSQAFTCQRKL